MYLKKNIFKKIFLGFDILSFFTNMFAFFKNMFLMSVKKIDIFANKDSLWDIFQ